MANRVHKKSERRSPFLFAWRHALASHEGPKNPIDRHVGMTVALYMNEDGQSAWPNQDTLARRTGYTDRTVGRALERLWRGQWLDRQARRSPKGRRHRRFGYEYWARLPSYLANAYAKGERASLFSGQGETTNGERDNARMANAVRTNTSVEYITKSMPLGKEDLPLPEEGATAAAKIVRQQRATRDEFVAAMEAEEARDRGRLDEGRKPQAKSAFADSV